MKKSNEATNAKTDTVKVLVTQQGDAVCGDVAYMLKKYKDIAAFYLDGWGDTGEIYCVAYGSSLSPGSNLIYVPSLFIENGNEESCVTTVCFPEYEGWRVHCAGGGKTMAICLVKD